LNSFELIRFHAWEEQILTQMDLLGQIARELHADTVSLELDKTKREMKEETFRFVVVGEFSRGKSTVINALLGDRLLPTSKQPTTAVLTRIKSGPKRSFTLHYRDDRTPQEISAEQFCALVAPSSPEYDSQEQLREVEKQNSIHRSLALVEITHTAAICNEGVEIVDTPGTNDLDPLREQITYDYIPRADAILFVLSAHGGFRRTELDFLRDRILKADISRIFFLINYSDRLRSAEERQSVFDACSSALAGLIDNPRLFFVSAKTALATRTTSPSMLSRTSDDHGFGKLERELSSFLETDRAKAKLQRPIFRGIRLCDELIDGPIAFSRSMIGLEIPELVMKKEALSPELQKIRVKRDRTISKLTVRLHSRRNEMTGQMRKGLRETANAALVAFDTYQGQVVIEEIGRHIEAIVAPVQSRFQSEFKAAASEAFCDEFRNIENDFERLQEELVGLFHDQVGLCLVSTDLQSGTSTFGAGGWTLLQIGGAGVGLLFLPFFAPLALMAGWFGGLFTAGILSDRARREKLGEIRNAVDVRYRGSIDGSVAAFNQTWDQAAAKAISGLAEGFDRRCGEIQISLDTAIANLTSASRTASQARADLDALESRARAVKASSAYQLILEFLIIRCHCS